MTRRRCSRKVVSLACFIGYEKIMLDCWSTKMYAAVCPSMLAGLIGPMLSMDIISPG